MGPLLFMAVPLLVLAYLSWHVWCLLPLPRVGKAVVVLLMISAFALLFVTVARSTDRLPLSLASTVYEIGTSSIIVMLYLFMIFLVLDLGRLVRLIPRTLLYNNWWTAGAVLAVLLIIFSYGNWHYRQKHREQLTLTTAKPMAKPLRMVMASDLHIGYHNRRAELARWVDMINAEHADVILIAGDIIDGSIRPINEEHMAEEFRRLNAPVYACLGNHEYYCGDAEAMRFYREAGIHLLRDSTAIVGDACIIGRDDRTNMRRQPLDSLMLQADRGKFTILLDHQPYHLEKAEKEHVDFQFSGHTHHGQVWPISWITEAVYECAFGTHQRGNTHYYVSSGLGIWGGKFRIGTRSEYVVVTVQQK